MRNGYSGTSAQPREKETATVRENYVYFKNAQNMCEIPDACVDFILTSPPYFNVKDYAKDGYQ